MSELKTLIKLILDKHNLTCNDYIDRIEIRPKECSLTLYPAAIVIYDNIFYIFYYNGHRWEKSRSKHSNMHISNPDFDLEQAIIFIKNELNRRYNVRPILS